MGSISKVATVESLCHGLQFLQHRGEDGAGVFVYDPKENRYEMRKGHGLVSQVFNKENIPMPHASWGIGHVRYSTIGKGNLEDLQPLAIGKKPTIAIAHNGNIINYVLLKEKLQKQGTSFQTSCDAEIILHLIEKYCRHTSFSFEDLCVAINHVYAQTLGAYSVIGMITGKGIFVFRDPHGIRPLLYGMTKDRQNYFFASEIESLSFLDLDSIEDIQPGELVFIDRHFQVQRRRLKTSSPRHCSFEFNYFAKPNAIIQKREVYRVRSYLGIALAKKVQSAEITADVIVPVPDSGRPSALSLGHALGLPIEEGFVKQNHIGRTFILPTGSNRKKAVCQKLIPVTSVFEGKRVIIVDDSIVRGTVSKRVIEMARKAGAVEITFASTYPPIRYPCIYGIDFSSKDQLIAHQKNLKEIAKEIKVDHLIYNDASDLEKAVNTKNLCVACINGKYPTSRAGAKEFEALRLKNLKEMEMLCKS